MNKPFILEGFVNFQENLSNSSFAVKHSENTIPWNNGYVNVENCIPADTNRYVIIVGIESNKNKEIGSFSNIILKEPISFSYFSSLLCHSSARKLALGVWYKESSNQLFLAREIFGLLPFYYIHIPNEFVAFSSNLVRLTEICRAQNRLELNHDEIITFSTFIGNPTSDYTSSTFYQNIKTVLPGHILTITPSSLTSTGYVQYQPEKWSQLRTSEEYGNILLELLTDSVYNNIQDESKLLGSHLSGGLDSSSISTLVKQIYPNRDLHTFYYSTHRDGTSDRNFALSVSNKIGSIHHEIIPLEDDFEMVQLHTAQIGHPQGKLISPTFAGSLIKYAADLGCHVLLDGNDGDSIVGSGMEYMEQLYKEKNWHLLKELLGKRVDYFSRKDLHANWDSLSFEEKKLLVEQNFIYNRLASQFKQLPLSKFFNLYREISKHFDLSMGYFLKRGWTSNSKKIFKPKIPDLSILRDDFFESTIVKPANSFDSLSKSLKGSLPQQYQQSFQYVFNAQAIIQNEEKFALSNHFGFSYRSPFYDKRLFELCMTIPELIQFGEGQGRAHFRAAMKGLLPEEVRVRHQKDHVGSLGRLATLRLFDQSKDFLMESKEVWEYIDKKKFLNAVKFAKIEGLRNQMYTRSLIHITRTVSLAVWLEWLKAYNGKN